MSTLRFLFLMLTLVLVPVAQATVPTTIDFQGFVRDSDGQPFIEENVILTTSLFNDITGGSAIWTEADTLDIDGGVFTTKLGDVEPLTLALFQDPTLFLEVSVDGNLSGSRTQLVSVPFALVSQLAQEAVHADSTDFATNAFHASYADSAGNGGGVGDGHWLAEGTSIHNTNSGSVGINNPTPTARMHIKTDSSVPGALTIERTDNAWATFDLLSPTSKWRMQTGPGQTLRFVDISGTPVDRLVLDGNGNYGFNTPTPQYKFHFNGGSATWPFYLTGTNALMLIDGQGNVPADTRIFQVSNASGSEYCVLGNGNVGIRTTNPTSPLTVNGDTDLRGNRLLYYGTGTDGFRTRTDPNFFGTDSDALVFEKTDGNQTHPDGGIAFVNTGSDGVVQTALAIRGTGNIGVATPTPGATLQLGGLDGIDREFRVYQGPNSNNRQITLARQNGGSYYIGTGSDDNIYVETYRGADRTFVLQNTYPNTKLNLLVRGDFCATGSKNAVVPTSQGMTKVYCDESTEVWFTDRGEGKTQNGSAHIELDPLFLETITVNADHPLRVHVDLYGTDRVPKIVRGVTGFDVMVADEDMVEFSWRVEAKRKGYESNRLETLEQADRNGR